MEFPTAMLGVALGVVLMPQLASARAGNDPDALFGHARLGPAAGGAAGRAVVRSRCWCSPSRWWRRCSTTAPSRTAMCRRSRWRWPATARAWSDWWPSRCWPGLLRQPGHAHAGAHRRSWCWSSRNCSTSRWCRAQARRAGAVDRHGRPHQRGLAACRPAQARQLPARRRAGPCSRCRSSPPARCWPCS